MSMETEIQNLMDQGVLKFWPPTMVSSGAKRDVFLTNDVYDFVLFQNGVDASFEAASGRALAKIDTFASGKTVVLGLDPMAKSPATLVARNAPIHKGVVDLRVTARKPDARIFGCFAKCDVLVLLTWAPKTGLHYAREVSRCRSIWDTMFPTTVPHYGSKHEHYLSSNVLAG